MDKLTKLYVSDWILDFGSCIGPLCLKCGKIPFLNIKNKMVEISCNCRKKENKILMTKDEYLKEIELINSELKCQELFCDFNAEIYCRVCNKWYCRSCRSLKERNHDKYLIHKKGHLLKFCAKHQELTENNYNFQTKEYKCNKCIKELSFYEKSNYKNMLIVYYGEEGKYEDYFYSSFFYCSYCFNEPIILSYNNDKIKFKCKCEKEPEITFNQLLSFPLINKCQKHYKPLLFYCYNCKKFKCQKCSCSNDKKNHLFKYAFFQFNDICFNHKNSRKKLCLECKSLFCDICSKEHITHSKFENKNFEIINNKLQTINEYIKNIDNVDSNLHSKFKFKSTVDIWTGIVRKLIANCIRGKTVTSAYNLEKIIYIIIISFWIPDTFSISIIDENLYSFFSLLEKEEKENVINLI